MVLGKFKRVFEQLLTPLAKPFINVNPNIVTILGLITSIPMIFIALYVENRQVATLLCLILLILSGMFDLIDGILARLKGRVTRKGTFLDSVCDRYVDMIALMILPLITKLDFDMYILIIFSILGTYMTSYARLRGESLGIEFIGIGLFERSERLIYLIALYIAYLITLNVNLAKLLLLVFAIIVNLTAIQRIVYSLKKLK